jgi:ATP-dependent NAD(P)H-hydrate dehydratase
MVHPIMRQEKNVAQSESAESVSAEVVSMLSRLHVIVIGPGLGRDKLMQDTCAKVIEEARKQGIPFVLDADGPRTDTARVGRGLQGVYSDAQRRRIRAPG